MLKLTTVPYSQTISCIITVASQQWWQVGGSNEFVLAGNHVMQHAREIYLLETAKSTDPQNVLFSKQMSPLF